MELLVDDILMEIFNKCNIKQISNIFKTCKKFNKIIGTKNFWNNMLLRVGIKNTYTDLDINKYVRIYWGQKLKDKFIDIDGLENGQYKNYGDENYFDHEFTSYIEEDEFYSTENTIRVSWNINFPYDSLSYILYKDNLEDNIFLNNKKRIDNILYRRELLSDENKIIYYHPDYLKNISEQEWTSTHFYSIMEYECIYFGYEKDKGFYIFYEPNEFGQIIDEIRYCKRVYMNFYKFYRVCMVLYNSGFKVIHTNE